MDIKTKNGWLVVASLALIIVLSWPVQPATGPTGPTYPAAPTEEITLELIMSHPDWLGRPPVNPYWALDGASFYYERKREGEEVRDLIQTDLHGKILRVVADEERGSAEVPGGQWSTDRKWKVYSREADIYVRNVATSRIQQRNRTAEAETDPHFMAGAESVWFRRGGTIIVRDLTTGLEYQPADLRLQKDPDEKDETFDYLKEQQPRLLEYVRTKKEKEELAKQRARREQESDPTRVALPWYLGDDVEIRQASLSPTGQWMVLVLRPKKQTDGRKDNMPNYVSESGYVDSREVRTKVGTGQPASEQLVLLDLAQHEKTELDLKVLPGIEDDPLSELRQKTEAARRGAQGEDARSRQASSHSRELRRFQRPALSRREVFLLHSKPESPRYL